MTELWDWRRPMPQIWSADQAPPRWVDPLPKPKRLIWDPDRWAYKYAAYETVAFYASSAWQQAPILGDPIANDQSTARQRKARDTVTLLGDIYADEYEDRRESKERSSVVWQEYKAQGGLAGVKARKQRLYGKSIIPSVLTFLNAVEQMRARPP